MEMSLKLEGLVKAKQDAWRLFEEQYGKKITLAEKKALADTLPEQYKDPKRKKPVCKASNLGEHHFFELLQWNPQAIKTTAILWKGNPNLTLVGLY